MTLLAITDCVYQQNGTKRIYHFSNHATVIEYPQLPTKCRFQFYDPRGNKVHTNAVRVEMKHAVERHKKQWKVKP